MAEARWLDAIGNEAWDLENASHFLGRVIPLINTNDGATTLLTVGGLFLLYHADVDSLCDPFFAVLRPGLSLEEIVARLPRKFIDNEDFAMGGRRCGEFHKARYGSKQCVEVHRLCRGLGAAPWLR